jgi:Tol biopolymer transport system component
LTGVRSHKKAAVFTGATSVLVLLLFLPTGSRLVRRLLNPPSQQSMSFVTSANISVFAAVSPDNRWIVHTEEKEGNQRLILINTANSNPVEIAAAANVSYRGITFTQDGNWLFFTRFENRNGSVYRLALPGGVPPVKIKDNVDSPISFSPQEDRFAFVRLDQGETVYSLIVSTIDGMNEQVLGTRKDGEAFSVHGLTWSPDGTLIVCPVGSWGDTYNVKLMAVDVATQNAQLIGDHSWHGILEIAWQDDMSGLVVSGRDKGSDFFRLWRIAYPDGERQQLTEDLAEYRGVSLSGQDIVTVRTEWSWDLVVIDRKNSSQRSRTVASGLGRTHGLAWAGNQRLLFSGIAEHLNISRIDADGSNHVKFTGQLNDNYTPTSSADGRFVVFSSNRTGRFNIWRMNAEDGSDLKQLTFTDGNFYPNVSSDNKWVIYDNQQKGQLSIWKAPLEGGDAVKIIDRYRMPVFSPDNELIAARYDPESGTNDAAIFPASGGEPIERFWIPMFDWQHVDWLSQNTLTYVDKADGYPNIWSYDRDTGNRKQLTHFSRNHIFSYRWSPDKSQLAVQLGTKTSNVVRIKNSW